MFKFLVVISSLTFCTQAAWALIPLAHEGLSIVDGQIQVDVDKGRKSSDKQFTSVLKFPEKRKGSSAKGQVVWKKDNSYQVYVRNSKTTKGKMTVLEANKLFDGENYIQGRDEVRASQVQDNNWKSHTHCDVHHDKVEGGKKLNLMDCTTVTPELCKKLGNINDLVSKSLTCATLANQLNQSMDPKILKAVKKAGDHNINRELRGFAQNFHRGKDSKGTMHKVHFDATVRQADQGFNGMLKTAIMCGNLTNREGLLKTLEGGKTPPDKGSSVKDAEGLFKNF